MTRETIVKENGHALTILKFETLSRVGYPVYSNMYHVKDFAEVVSIILQDHFVISKLCFVCTGTSGLVLSTALVMNLITDELSQPNIIYKRKCPKSSHDSTNVNKDINEDDDLIIVDDRIETESTIRSLAGFLGRHVYKVRAVILSNGGHPGAISAITELFPVVEYVIYKNYD